MCRIRCKGKEDKGFHEYGSRIDPIVDVVINGFEGFEEVLSPIDLSLTSISKRGGVSEDVREGRATRPTRYLGNTTSSCYQTG